MLPARRSPISTERRLEEDFGEDDDIFAAGEAKGVPERQPVKRTMSLNEGIAITKCVPRLPC